MPDNTTPTTAAGLTGVFFGAEMTPTETAAALRQYNQWRRGNLEGQPQPGPREISEAIDAAIEMIDRLEAAESDALEQARLNGMGASREASLMAKLKTAEKSDAESIAMYRKARDERDALRAKVSDLMINVAFLDNLKKSYEELIEELQEERDELRAKIEAMERQEHAVEGAAMADDDYPDYDDADREACKFCGGDGGDPGNDRVLPCPECNWEVWVPWE